MTVPIPTTDFSRKLEFANQTKTTYSTVLCVTKHLVRQLRMWSAEFMEIGLSPGDFVLDGDPARPLNFRPMFITIIVSRRTRMKRLYACAQIHYLCFSNYRIWINDVTDVICAKNRLQHVQSYRYRNVF